MPRPTNAVPSYLHHKPSGQAYCTIREADGSRRTVYLGAYGTEASRAEYARVIGGHKPTPAPSGRADVAPLALTVAELCRQFIDHAERYYRHADRTPTGEATNFKHSLRALEHLFGALPVAEFGPKALQRVRSLMIDGYKHPEHGEHVGLSRRVVNQRVGRIKRVFRWGVQEELVPVAVYQAIAAVEGLKAGRCDATELPPVEPVVWADVEKTLAKLNPVVKAMVLLQWHTGMRPGEVCAMRWADVDRSGAVWVYRPRQHKTAYRNRARVVAIGPQSQAILAEFVNVAPAKVIFSPALAMSLVYAQRRAGRKTPVQPSQQCRKKAKAKRKPGERYTTETYNRAVARAAELAGVTAWHPNQLRHSFGTRVRAVYHLEGAQVALGHAQANVTEVYAERDLTLAMRVAGEMG